MQIEAGDRTDAFYFEPFKIDEAEKMHPKKAAALVAKGTILEKKRVKYTEFYESFEKQVDDLREHIDALEEKYDRFLWAKNKIEWHIEELDDKFYELEDAVDDLSL